MKTQRILIINDSQMLTRALSRFLTRRGFEPVVAYNTSEAWRALESGPYDLVLLDVNLPDGSGLDLLQKIESRLPPVILTTAEDRSQWEQRAIALGVKAYLIKPFPTGTLEQTVSCLLEGQCCFPHCSKGYHPEDAPPSCPLRL